MMMGRPGCTQPPEDRPAVGNPDFDRKISNMIQFSVPVIGVQELRAIQEEVLIFDAREREEFEISHIEGARYLGYKQFEESALMDLPKDQKIVLYCSIGYRSEKVAEKLKALGFEQVYNLYGSIFEWVNAGFPIVGPDGQQSKQLHTYNAKWSKWVDPQQAERVW